MMSCFSNIPCGKMAGLTLVSTLLFDDFSGQDKESCNSLVSPIESWLSAGLLGPSCMDAPLMMWRNITLAQPRGVRNLLASWNGPERLGLTQWVKLSTAPRRRRWKLTIPCTKLLGESVIVYWLCKYKSNFRIFRGIIFVFCNYTSTAQCAVLWVQSLQL